MLGDDSRLLAFFRPQMPQTSLISLRQTHVRQSRGRPPKPVRRRFTALIGQRCAAREEINMSIETVIGTVGRLPNDRDLAAPCRPVSARGELRSSINCGWMSPPGSANQLASTWRSPRILGPLVISGSAGRRPRPCAEDKRRSRRWVQPAPFVPSVTGPPSVVPSSSSFVFLYLWQVN